MSVVGKQYGIKTLLSVIAVCLVSVFLCSYIINVGWGWFITPKYGIAQPGMVTIMASQVMLGLFRGRNGDVFTEDEKKNILISIVNKFLTQPIIAFGILYLYTLFI